MSSMGVVGGCCLVHSVAHIEPAVIGHSMERLSGGRLTAGSMEENDN
jgi:hypothetical protein